MTEAMPSDVQTAFDRFEPTVRDTLRRCRALVFSVAAECDAVGLVSETLKWGQPAYLTETTRAGSTLRLGQYENAGVTADTNCAALYVHCATDLIEQFRQFYPDCFIYQGKRALVINGDIDPVIDELRHCIALALTYRLRKRPGQKSTIFDTKPKKPLENPFPLPRNEADNGI
jgi:hypothetical protein